MQESNINRMISNALQVKKDNLNKDIINKILKALENSKPVIEEANKIDNKNNNGFILDFSIINNIFSNLEKEELLYGTVTLSQKDEEKKIIYGTQIMDYGNVVVINDGNTYVIIEMAIRNILAGNTVIFNNNGYMYGTNNLIIEIIQSVLVQSNISKDMIQIYISEEVDDILKHYANIDLVICIGDHNLQSLVLNKSKNKTIVSGYENFDLYIEDISHMDLIKKILNTGLNIQLYVNDNIDINIDDGIVVNDIDEAIAQINYNSSKYSVAIFTSSTEHASKFIKEVKASMITVNTSPTIERIIDIKQEDLICKKTVIYPLTFKFDGNSKIIDNKDI